MDAGMGSFINEFISTIGFPIACTIAMFWSQNKEREQHQKETDGFVSAIQNNTMAITKLIEKIDDMEGK